MTFESYIESMNPLPWTFVKDHPNEWLVGNSSAAINYIRFKLIIEALKDKFKEGDKLFDVGVYPGDIPQMFNEFVAGEKQYTYIGIGLGFTEEFTEAMKKVFVDLYECDLDPRINYKHQRNNQIKLECDYDICIFGDVIEHFFDPFYPLKQINKNLRLGGTLILTTDNITHLANTVSFLRGGSPNVPLMNGNLFYDGDWRPHFREYSKQELFDLLRWAGFEVEEHQYYEAQFGFYKVKNGKLIYNNYTQKSFKDKLKTFLRDSLKSMFPHLKDNHFIIARKVVDYERMELNAPKLTSDNEVWLEQRKKLS